MKPIADEAILVEALRFSGTCSLAFSLGLRASSSSPSGCEIASELVEEFKGVDENEAEGRAIFEVPVWGPLKMILPNGKEAAMDGGSFSGGEFSNKEFVKWREVVTEPSSGANQQEEWSNIAFEVFNNLLGMPTIEFKEEILALMVKMRNRRDEGNNGLGRKKRLNPLSKFDKELKRLECSVNYGRGVSRRGGRGKEGWNLVPVAQ